jgi:hypothetical protein
MSDFDIEILAYIYLVYKLMDGRNDEKEFVRPGGSAVAEDTAKTLIWTASL